MLQTSVAAPVEARPLPETLQDCVSEPLWRLAGDLRAARALVVAEHGCEMMCELIRRGCLAATVLRPGDKPDADDYTLVLVPRAAALPSSDAVIRLARRALTGGGRLIAGVRDGREAAALVRRLRLNGYSGLHSVHLAGVSLVRADLRRPA